MQVRCAPYSRRRCAPAALLATLALAPGLVFAGGLGGEHTDLLTFAEFVACLSRPTDPVIERCVRFDFDGDGDVDFRDYAALQLLICGPQRLLIPLESDGDDGIELDGIWWPDGLDNSNLNPLGYESGNAVVGLRFRVPEVYRGESFAYARLVIPATDDGYVPAPFTTRIAGCAEDSAVDFAELLPHARPRTAAAALWLIDQNWPAKAGESQCHPLFRRTPDISEVVNEILARPGWGSGVDGKIVALLIEDGQCCDDGYLVFHDYYQNYSVCPGRAVGVRLELFRSITSTFIGQELLTCPTDSSIRVNACSLLPLDVSVEYGVAPGYYSYETDLLTCPGESPFSILLTGLSADTRYYYRLRFRVTGGTSFAFGVERTFRTQRPPGSSFTFTVQADSHMEDPLSAATPLRAALYRRMQDNVKGQNPDFHLDLGDTFCSESYATREVLDAEEALERHLNQRHYFDYLSHSTPLFLVIGNHEGEQGWRLDGTLDNLAVWATLARKLVYPMPEPDAFYSGDEIEHPFVGRRQSYYAWTWGDALFVVLDPFWNTLVKPHDFPLGGPPGSGNRWDWTLGFAQYNWLAQTLAASNATYKFVFIHHLVGGWDPYGRGGIEAVRHALGGQGSWEWGGEDPYGCDCFDRERPGWGVPIHELLVQHQVTICFHAHDHAYVYQTLDGVVYQECPQPTDIHYGYGHADIGGYTHGMLFPNSGHLRVNVTSPRVTVDYIRAFLPGDGLNGSSLYSYSIARP